VLLFHRQQYNKHGGSFNPAVDNALVLVLVILNIWDFKVDNTTID
jgi:hypothetical protein